MRLVVQGGSLTGAQSAAVQSFFIACCEEHRLSVAPSFSRSRTLADGVWAKVNIIGGVASVLVSVQGEQGAAGIGMRLVGWDGAPIPELSTGGVAHYYLAALDAQGKWNITRRASLVGGQSVWVGTDRTRWLSTVLSEGDDASGASALTYFRNREVSDTARPSNIYPAAVRAARRGAAAANEPNPVSFLSVSNGTIELLQRDAEGAYVAVDTVQVDGGRVNVLSAAGNFALATAGDSAHLITLSPALEVVEERAIAATEGITYTSSGTVSYAGTILITPSSTPKQWKMSDLSAPPDLESVTVVIDLPSNSPWSPGAEISQLRTKHELAGHEPVSCRVYQTSLSPHVEGAIDFCPIYWVDSCTIGVWGKPVLINGLDIGPSSSSAQATYTESYVGSGVISTSVAAHGIKHDGSPWQINRSTSVEESIEGTKTFTDASPSVRKTVTWKETETWTLPEGQVVGVSSVSEVFAEDTSVNYPSMWPAEGEASVTSTVSRTKLVLLHYDADTDCAVFSKEVAVGGGVRSWRRSSYAAGATMNSSPLGSYFCDAGDDITNTFSGTATVSVCVYQSGVLAYEEVLASGPCSGGSTKYEPKAYPDMRFGFGSGAPKPSAGAWPEATVVYGPSAPYTKFTYEERVLYGSVDTQVCELVPLDDSGSNMLAVWTTVPAETYQHPVAGLTTHQIERELHIDRSDVLTNTHAEIYQANASMSERFDVSVGTAKDARTGGLALEIHYSYDGFAEPKDRARILLVSSGGVTQLDELLKPSDGAEKFEFKTTFLATI